MGVGNNHAALDNGVHRYIFSVVNGLLRLYRLVD